MLNKYSTTNPKYSTLPTYLDKVRECDRDNLMVEFINKIEQTQNNYEYIEPQITMNIDDILYDLDENEQDELDNLKDEYTTLHKQLKKLKVMQNSTDFTVYGCIIVLGYILAIVFYATELYTVLQTFGIATLLIPICYIFNKLHKININNKIKSINIELQELKKEIKELTKSKKDSK